MTDRSDSAKQGADFSEDRVYLYKRWHRWSEAPSACFCMLNPPFLDKDCQEPIAHRCETFARSWECGGIEIVNLFGIVTCHLDDLRRHSDPVGPRNDQTIIEAAKNAGSFIAAWTCFDLARKRIHAVEKMLNDAGVKIMCLGTTRGYPTYPFFAAADARPVSYVHLKEIDHG